MKRKSLIAILSLIGIILLFQLFTPTPTTSQENCKNPTKLEDYTDRDKSLLICEDSVKYGDVIVTNKNDTPEIFEYKFNDKETWDVTHEVVIYSIEEGDYIAIFPVVNAMTWYIRSGYIFQKVDDSYKLIFNREFDNLSGRWAGVRFVEGGSIHRPNTIVVNQDLGPMGALGNRIRWTDYYEWSKDQNTYVLSNDEMDLYMEELLKEYEEINRMACSNETYEKESRSVSVLFASRVGKNPFCDDESPQPYITNGQAEIFLKAKFALTENINGNNYSFDDIANLPLE